MMKNPFFVALFFSVSTSIFAVYASETRSRVIVMADMGHDPDEEQQIAHLLVCSNQFDLEGLICVTGRFFRPNPTDSTKWLMPHLFHQLIDGYESVYENLKLHTDGWQEPDYLRSIVANGQTGNGMMDVGKGRWSRGSRLIAEALRKPDPRPLHIVINAGANTLAQTLFGLREECTTEELKRLVRKLRVYENSGQDDTGAWICHEFPDIHWIRSVAQSRTYGGPSNAVLGPQVWKPFPNSPKGQHQWAKEHVQEGHGLLGMLYPDRTVGSATHYIEGGGTIPWMGFAAPGLSDPSEPSWGGWSGRYSIEKQMNVASHFAIIHPDEKKFEPYAAYTDRSGISDQWIDPENGEAYESVFAAVWRWRRAMWNDFRTRMDWCVAKFGEANHHPRAVLDGDTSDAILRLSAKLGEELILDAGGSSDPDGDGLHYRWWVYPEAGRKPYGKVFPIAGASDPAIRFTIPSNALGKELHVILEVWDDDDAVPLVDYRRVVITVDAASRP